MPPDPECFQEHVEDDRGVSNGIPHIAEVAQPPRDNESQHQDRQAERPDEVNRGGLLSLPQAEDGQIGNQLQ